MSLYLFVKLVHIVSGFILYSLWVAELIVFLIKNKNPKIDLGIKKIAPLSMLCMLLTLVSGTYLMIVAWGPQAWIATALINFVLIIILALAFRKRSLVVSNIKLTVGLTILVFIVLKPNLVLSIVFTVLAWTTVILRSRKNVGQSLRSEHA